MSKSILKYDQAKIKFLYISLYTRGYKLERRLAIPDYKRFKVADRVAVC